MRVRIPEQAGYQARHDGAVLQRVAGAGGCLGAVGEDPETAVGAPRKVRRIQGQARRRHARRDHAGAQEPGVRIHEIGGQQPIADQGTGAVEIGENEVEQLRALRQAGFDAGPFAAADQQRDGVESPGMIQAVRDAVDVIGRAVTAQHAHGVALSLAEHLRTHGLERIDQVAPVRTHLPGGGAHFVEDACQGIVRRALWHRVGLAHGCGELA